MTAVSVSRADGVATVLVESPPVNAMSRTVLTGIAEATRGLAHDRDVRAVILTGAGDKAFMAGADIGEFQEFLAGGREALEEYTAWTAELFAGWCALPQPTIAAVQADAMGGGLEMALACDLVVLDAEARVGLPEVRLGLIPGGGGTQRLAARTGSGQAKRLTMLGLAISAAEAERLGVVDVIADPGEALDSANEIATRLARLPAKAVQSLKRAIDAPRADSLSDGLAIEREAFFTAFESDDFQEGYTAFLEKRRPQFSHR